MKLRAPVAPVLALVLVLVGCGGGSGSPTAPRGPSLTFVGDGTAGANSISLRRAARSTAAILFLEVAATEVSDLFGVAFDLRLPPNLLRYAGATEGGLLGAAGSVATSLQVIESPTGTVIVGLSRLGNVAGATGSGVLVTLELHAQSAGSGALSFANNVALDPQGRRQTGVNWLAGSVEVRL